MEISTLPLEAILLEEPATLVELQEFLKKMVEVLHKINAKLDAVERKLVELEHARLTEPDMPKNVTDYWVCFRCKNPNMGILRRCLWCCTPRYDYGEADRSAGPQSN